MDTDRRPTRRVAIPATAFLLAAGAASSPVLAVAYSWDAAVNGDFHDDAKWNPNTGSPTSGDTATFGQASGSYTVGVSADASTGKLAINAGNTVTLDMSGQTYTASVSANNPGVVLGGTAKLILTDSEGGGVLRNLALAENIPVSIGGSGLELNTSGGFGATFTIHGEFQSSSPVLVTGVGSHLNHDQGFFTLFGNSLTIQDGGVVHASNFQYTKPGGGESVVVDGVGSQLITNANGARVVAWGPSTASVINGGLWDTTGLQFEIGVLYGAGQLVTVGDGVNTTATSTIKAGDFFFVGLVGDPRGVSEMRVHSDGYIEATSATNSIRVTDGDTLTMIGGVADIASG